MAKRTKTLQKEICNLVNNACKFYCSTVKYDQSWEAVFNLSKLLRMMFREVVIDNGQYMHTVKPHTEIGKSWVCTINHNGVTVKFNIMGVFTMAGQREEYALSLYEGHDEIHVNDPITKEMTSYNIPNLVYYND